MNRQILPAILCAAAALCSISTARGTILVYEGFHEGDWTDITATDSQTIQNGTTTGNYSSGFAVGSKWSMADNTTQISVSGTDYGLALPAVMAAKGFTTCGGAAQCNPGQNSSELRGGRHDFASNTLKVSSGTLYVRALVRLTASAAAKLNSVATPDGNADGSYFGFGLIGSTSSNRYAPTLTSNESSCSFLMWKNSDGTLVLSLCLIDAAGTLSHYPLVTGVTLGSTYLCYAEIRVGASTDGAELVRAGAVDVADFTGAVSWAALGKASDTVEVQLITDSAYPKSMAFTGPYGTNGGSFRADELVVGTELGDIVPVGGVFSVSGTGLPTVATNSFSTAWILVADEGVTANAGLVWSTDETFATATTNSLGTGLSADTRTATLSGLEPDTTYWWKIYADNGSAVAESAVYSFTTTGAPVLGTATATVDGETASFSVALATAAMENTLATSVSVFYGTDGETWTELPLGSASEAQTFSGTVQSLGDGVTCQWFARATATMEGGRVLSSATATNSFTTLWGGEMYVDAAAANAAVPYSTPETAAPNIATALAVATDGATIHVAPGLYPISTPLVVTNVISVIGDDPDPSRTVVSNADRHGDWGVTRRVFTINHADAFVANLTMQSGYMLGSDSGGNFSVGSAGGTVSNCVIEAGGTRGNNYAAGGRLSGGLVTHTIFRKNICGSEMGHWQGQHGAVLELFGSSRAENCLLVDNPPSQPVYLTLVGDSAVMRNCTIADTGLSKTNGYCKVFTAIRINSSKATVLNTVIAGVTNKIDGAACPPTGSGVANFLNGAFDGDVTGLPVGTVTGTAAEFFKDYGSGDYRPKTGGVLVNKGQNYEPTPAKDLGGNKRLIGSKIDIGCYEANAAEFCIRVR